MADSAPVSDHTLASLAAMTAVRTACDTVESAFKAGQLDGMKPTFRVSTKTYSIPGADATARSATGVTLTLAMKFERVIETPSTAATAEAAAVFNATLGEALAEDGMPPATEPEHKKHARVRYAPKEEYAIEYAAVDDRVLPSMPPGGAAAGVRSMEV